MAQISEESGSFVKSSESEMVFEKRKEPSSTMEVVRILSSNYMYIACTLSLSLMFFIATNVQFWITDYFLVVIEAPKEDIALAVLVICVTSPIIGAILSGHVANCVGGYKSRLAMPTVVGLISICNILAIPVPLLNDFWTIVVILWFYFFFGSIMLPMLTGIMISSVEPYLRSKANALANISYNLLGYFPAPFIYGIICEHTGGEKSRWGLTITFILNIFPLILLFIALFVD